MANIPSAFVPLRQAARQAKRAGKFTGEKPSFLLYTGLLVLALFKDLLDYVGVGSLPGIGLVVTACFTFIIWLLLLVFDRSGGRQNKKMMQGIILLFVTMVEGVFFGVNFLPIQTLTIILLYQMANKAHLKARQHAAEEAKQEKALARKRAAEARRWAEERSAWDNPRPTYV